MSPVLKHRRDTEGARPCPTFQNTDRQLTYPLLRNISVHRIVISDDWLPNDGFHFSNWLGRVSGSIHLNLTTGYHRNLDTRPSLNAPHSSLYGALGLAMVQRVGMPPRRHLTSVKAVRNHDHYKARDPERIRGALRVKAR